MTAHIIDPDVIRDLYARGRQPAAIAYLFQRSENHIREVLGLKPLAEHQIKAYQPLSGPDIHQLRGRPPGPRREDGRIVQPLLGRKPEPASKRRYRRDWDE